MRGGWGSASYCTYFSYALYVLKLDLLIYLRSVGVGWSSRFLEMLRWGVCACMCVYDVCACMCVYDVCACMCVYDVCVDVKL